MDPASLRRAVGPDTRIIGVSSGDPLGLGMNSTTMSAILGGEITPAAGSGASSKASAAFADPPRPKRRSCSVAPARGRFLGNRRAQEELGIDHVVSGYCEGNIGALFARLLDGEELPGALAGERVAAAEKIPPILGPRSWAAWKSAAARARLRLLHARARADGAPADGRHPCRRAGEPRRRRDGPRSRHRGRFPLRGAGRARAAGGADRTRHAPALSRPDAADPDRPRQRHLGRSGSATRNSPPSAAASRETADTNSSG